MLLWSLRMTQLPQDTVTEGDRAGPVCCTLLVSQKTWNRSQKSKSRVLNLRRKKKMSRVLNLELTAPLPRHWGARCPEKSRSRLTPNQVRQGLGNCKPIFQYLTVSVRALNSRAKHELGIWEQPLVRRAHTIIQ